MSVAESQARGDNRGNSLARETFRLSVLAVLTACQPGPSPAQPVAPAAETPHSDRLAPAPVVARAETLSVGVRLDAETRVDAQGVPRDALWLALRLELPPATHVYWSNPGESGLATTARFSAAPGLALSRVHYPGPKRFRSERGATSYGYQDELALLVQVTGLNAKSAAEVHHFTVEAQWLACSDQCVAEHATVSLALDATHREQTSPRPIAWWLEQRIRAAEELPLQVTWPTSQEVVITAEPGTGLEEFFPDTPLTPDESDPQVTRPHPNQLRVVHPRRPDTQPLSGVVRAKIAEKTRFYAVKLR